MTYTADRDPNTLLSGVSLPDIGMTEGSDDPKAMAHLYIPGVRWHWYPTERTGDRCYGLVVGHEVEYGEFFLSELVTLEANGVGVMRDLAFEPTSVRLLKRAHDDDGEWWVIPERQPQPPMDDSSTANPILFFILADGEDMDWDDVFNLFD